MLSISVILASFLRAGGMGVVVGSARRAEMPVMVQIVSPVAIVMSEV